MSDNKGPVVYTDDVAEILKKFLIGMSNCRTMRWTGQVERRGDMRNALKNLV
jgi:hypothetical protein